MKNLTNDDHVMCIYHGNCADGFGAAWVVRLRNFPHLEFHAGTYGSPPPDVTGKHVIIVDFSYKRDILMAMSNTAASITVLDHHATAIEDLEGIQLNCPNSLVLSNEHSGAMLTWLYFFPGEEPPELLKHIEDRDLWAFKHPDTVFVAANLFSYPYDFQVWNNLMAEPIAEFAADGEAIYRKHMKDIHELLAASKRQMRIGGELVNVANLPYTMASEGAGILAIGQPFAATYMDTATHRVFSLRSSPQGADVAKIAESYGGGGHTHASGFRMPIGWEGDAA